MHTNHLKLICQHNPRKSAIIPIELGIRQNIPFSQKKQKKEFEKSVGILSEKNKKTPLEKGYY